MDLQLLIIPPAPRRWRGVYCFTSVRPSVIQDIFRRIFLSNYQWQKSDIWSQASYRYAILWVAFLDPSDSYFLFADLVGFYTHWTYIHNFRHIFLIQSVPITTGVVSLNPTQVRCTVLSIQHYVMKIISDLQQVCGFLWVLRFLPSIKLIATI